MPLGIPASRHPDYRVDFVIQAVSLVPGCSGLIVCASAFEYISPGQGMKKIYIGCGAGFAGDRFDASGPVIETLAKADGPKYLIFEVLAERTLAIAQRLRRNEPDAGYSPYLDHYIKPILGKAKEAGVRIVSNMGAANPRGAAKRVLALAAEAGHKDFRVAIVQGDDLLEVHETGEIRKMPTIEGIGLQDREIIAANAYLGARPVADALALDVDIVLVGRSTDAALVLGPLIHEFGWAEDDWDLLAQGTMAGHLLECGAQVTGAYFADPGFKDVPDLAEVGFPIAEIEADSGLVITKADNTGGLVSRATVIEQALYEIHDPASYLTPDVIMDLSGLQVEEIAPNRVLVSGAKGRAPTTTLKATISIDGGWLGEGEITYAGPNALARAELAASVVQRRCQIIGIQEPVRVEVIGRGAVHDNDMGSRRTINPGQADGEYRVRAAVRSQNKETAQRVSDEVLSLYCSGPAAGGGVRQYVSGQVSTASVLVDRKDVLQHVRAEEVRI
jgi:hypothetical protein